MERWVGKVALITGASAGIGAATAVALANNGMKVVGIARRQERIEELKQNITGSGEIHAFKCDVAKEEDIKALCKKVKEEFGAIHVLVNNAGIGRPGKVTEQETRFFREILDVNVLAPAIFSQEAVKIMKENGIDDGHIININSICGHSVISDASHEPNHSLYTASKFALTALNETIRQELRAMKTKIRVTSISPGVVYSEFGAAAAKGLGASDDKAEIISKMVKSLPGLQPEDIADAIIYVLSAPQRVQIHELTIKPVGEPF